MADFYSGLSRGLTTGAEVGTRMASSLRQQQVDEEERRERAEEKAYRRGRDAKADERTERTEQRQLDAASLGFVEGDIAKNLAASAEYLKAGKKDDPALRGLTDARRKLTKKRDDLRARITGQTYRDEYKEAQSDWQALQEGALTIEALPADRAYRMLHHLGTVNPEDYLRRGGQPSKVDLMLTEVNEAMARNDLDAAFQAARPLVEPYFEVGYGEEAEDGSVKRRKTPTAIYPAEGDPDSVYIGLDVETEREDGARGTKHALYTSGQRHGEAEEPVKVPISRLTELLGNHMDLLEEVNGNQALAQKIEEALASGAGQHAQDAYAAFIADGGRLDTLDAEKTRSEIDKNKSAAELNRARAKNAAKTGAAGAGKGSADIQMLERLSTTLFADVKDPKKRERLALDELGKIKRMAQKSSGREQFVAEMVARQSALKTKAISGEESLVWQGRHTEMMDYVKQLADQIYPKGAGDRGAGAQAGGPQEGDEEDGYRFLGGDPSDPDNWEEVE